MDAETHKLVIQMYTTMSLIRVYLARELISKYQNNTRFTELWWTNATYCRISISTTTCEGFTTPNKVIHNSTVMNIHCFVRRRRHSNARICELKTTMTWRHNSELDVDKCGQPGQFVQFLFLKMMQNIFYPKALSMCYDRNRFHNSCMTVLSRVYLTSVIFQISKTNSHVVLNIEI